MKDVDLNNRTPVTCELVLTLRVVLILHIIAHNNINKALKARVGARMLELTLSQPVRHSPTADTNPKRACEVVTSEAP